MNLHELLQELRQMHDERAEEIASLEADLAPLQNRIAYLRQPLEDLEEAIKEEAIRIAATTEAYGIKVSYRKGYTRTSWDGKLLDGFAMAHPEILAARKESTISPSASVKILERETA